MSGTDIRALNDMQTLSGELDLSQGDITFTEEGRRRAEKIYERHKLLTEFFITLGVDPEIAAEDACRLEHVISDVTFEAIKKHAGQKGL